ncbi:hypothetical protein O181_008256 [Austropuccinia psidii MF-1]|uniref:Uncharacterized protein n=1 Tax=Austropuccinia psidii MF-1 TaxID=1389203 RepID=A0A9Q3BM95_9BASI|nr:hypothetical protein [Austropuccinia psidii MF-1]
MEDFRASTCCQRLASTFETLLEIPEAEITAIAVVRPESFPTGSSEDIPVSVQELVYGRKKSEVGTSAKSLCRDHEFLSSIKEALGPESTEDLLNGWTPMSCKVQVQKIKVWLKDQSILSVDRKKDLSQKRDNSQVEAPQVSTSKILHQQLLKRERNLQRSIGSIRKRKR